MIKSLDEVGKMEACVKEAMNALFELRWD